MPAILPHLPINRFQLSPLADVAPGSLAVLALPNRPAPVFLFKDPAEQPSRPYGLMLDISAHPNGSFLMFAIERDHTQWLSIDDWSLIVDPESAYTGQTDMPAKGDAFISSGVPGIIGFWGQVEGFVSVAGRVLKTPDWAGRFVGFRSWRMVMDVPGQKEPHTLLSWDRRKP